MRDSTNKNLRSHSDFRVLLVYANSPMDNLVPVSISSLSGALKRSGFNVKVFDTTFYPWTMEAGGERKGTLQVVDFDYSTVGIKFFSTDVFDDFRKIVKEYNPHLIGLSTVEPTHEFGLKLLKTVRDSGIPTIVGGVHTIFSPDDVINEDTVDMVCVGEGESALVDLCCKMASGEYFESVENIWIKRNGKVRKNKVSLMKIEEVPELDFSVFDEKRIYRPMAGRLYRMAPVEFSRGCVYHCTYCSAPSLAAKFNEQGRWLRYKPIERIIDEIKVYIDKYRIEYFYFVSETFLVMSKNRFEEFCRQYAKIRVPFWFNTRPETITEDKIRMLEDIGCHRMSIGVECGNEKYRREMLKRFASNLQIIKACDIVSKSAIQLSVNNIIGLPDETREMVFETIFLNRNIDANSYSCSIFQPYRGTELRKYCVEKGYIDAAYLAYDLTYASPLKHPYMSGNELRGLARVFPLYVKFPAEEFELIREAESFNENGDRIFGELSAAYRQKYEKCVEGPIRSRMNPENFLISEELNEG